MKYFVYEGIGWLKWKEYKKIYCVNNLMKVEVVMLVF